MAVTIIKSANSDNQAIVNSSGELLVSASVSPTPGAATAANQEIEIGYLEEIANNTRINSKGFSTISGGQSSIISVGLTSIQLLAANTARIYTHIINQGNAPIYIQYAVDAIVNRGIRLNPGGLWTISGGELWLGIITAISTSPSQDVEVLEGIE